jgi:hypothetical protein
LSSTAASIAMRSVPVRNTGVCVAGAGSCACVASEVARVSGAAVSETTALRTHNVVRGRRRTGRSAIAVFRPAHGSPDGAERAGACR